MERELEGDTQRIEQSLKASNDEPILDATAVLARPAWGGESEGLAPEVRAYEDFIATYGETGGWSEEEHTAFLTMRERYDVRVSFAFSAVSLFCFCSLTCVLPLLS